jgi:hypothetical protein
MVWARAPAAANMATHSRIAVVSRMRISLSK